MVDKFVELGADIFCSGVGAVGANRMFMYCVHPPYHYGVIFWGAVFILFAGAFAKN